MARWATLAIAGAVLLLAGCGGNDDESMRATLTDSGCTYEGPTAQQAGRFDIAVSNESRLFSGFFLAAVAKDASAAELQTTIDDLLRRFHKPGESPSRAPWRTLVGSEVEPAATSVIPADVRAGTYVVLCFVSRPTDTRQSSNEPVPPQAIYVATRLDVTGEPTYDD
ncbi:MAG TPA: hypothetical protein VFT33_00520 [Gaiellaceae bacterium]|nr:hypothetical protein [Gaiellaceae bacterium]